MSLRQACGFQNRISIVRFLRFYMSEFLTKDVLECAVNPTYLTAHLFNIIFTTYFILFNTIHKMGRYEFWCYLKWYNYMWTGDLLTIHFSYSNSYEIIVIGRVICFRNTKNYNFQLNISNSYFVSTILISLVWA